MNNKLLTYTKQELTDYILTLEKVLKQKEDQLINRVDQMMYQSKQKVKELSE